MTQSRRWVGYSISILSVMAVFSTGCSKEQKPDEQLAPTAPAADENVMGDSDSGRAMGMQTVHFPYDAFVLDEEAKRILNANVEILKDKGSIKIQIEGHCDERGGVQYNIALGEKRANATKKFLVDLGIAADRITIITFGKEKPIDPGKSEDAYARNRRANFVVTAR